jgi:DMSO/TMAO reductase YedYZ molybdopterin-dependent catalytic subunit
MAKDDGVIGRIKDKLVESKQRWAREGRLLTGRGDAAHANRLPPGQREVMNWPVLDLGIQPEIALADWRLTVDGLVGHPLDWSWDDFLAQPQTDDVSDIHCVTAWSRYDNHWQGVSARHLLSLAAPLPAARHVICHSHDGYTTNLRLEMFAGDDVLLAHRWEGKPIPVEHGGPVRVVVPSLYFWKSAKWLRRLEFTAEDRPGFWEVRGYHNEADPWQEERYG